MDAVEMTSSDFAPTASRRALAWKSAPSRVHYWWAPPRRRKPGLQESFDKEEDDGEEIHEHWIELLNDLVLVAFLTNLGHLLAAGGDHAANYFTTGNIFFLQLQSMHFVSHTVNFYMMDDLLMLFLLLVVTTGCFLMADSIHVGNLTDCMVVWPPLQFDIGLILSHASQLFVRIKCSWFISGMLRYNAWFMALSVFVIFLCILRIHVFHFTQAKYMFPAMNGFNLLAGLMSLSNQEMYSALDVSHLNSRLSFMVLICMGEWVIQICTKYIPQGDVEYSLSQLGLCFAIALQYFNTRPHNFQAKLSMDSPGRGAAFFLMHYWLAFSLWLVGCSVDLQITFLALRPPEHGPEPGGGGGGQPGGGDHGDDGGGTDPPETDHRRLSGGSAPPLCPHGWGPDDGVLMGAYGLATAHVLIVTLRHMWKEDTVRMHIRPGLKFIVRLALGASHAAVPWIVFYMFGSVEKEAVELRHFTTPNWIHCALAFPAVLADLAVFPTASRTKRMASTGWLSATQSSAAHRAAGAGSPSGGEVIADDVYGDVELVQHWPPNWTRPPSYPSIDAGEGHPDGDAGTALAKASANQPTPV